ncbi:UbiA family prenyltransferase [Aspergillus affinis]|uniref:UbiA family prenyltransferase n=1 Tax=Aspergillus affinis TaxID=1070780 RepID=UPI0022FEDAE0|nr:uncharacterized protein KD926_010451 [Aspergillus affinis]KAI9038716.1 hypothetical protein KD926_010451 [Aspergillus affinis]
MSLSSPTPIRLTNLPSLVWDLSKNDIPTFVLPNTAFGIASAIVAPALTYYPESPRIGPLLVQCTPWILLFNWSNLLVFNLANQRLADSIQKDRVNKPWRPLPRGRITPTQATRFLLGAVPVVNAELGAVRESAGIVILAWKYNDLRGGDELTRDPIIAIAYTIFNVSSLQIAVGSASAKVLEFTTTGYCWLGMIAGMILTTMQVQDLKDQRGDWARGRKTWPLVMGDRLSRRWIAGSVNGWSLAAVGFWNVSVYLSVGVVLLGAWVGSSVVLGTGDGRTWRWCLWQCCSLHFACLENLEWTFNVAGERGIRSNHTTVLAGKHSGGPAWMGSRDSHRLAHQLSERFCIIGLWCIDKGLEVGGTKNPLQVLNVPNHRIEV